MYTAVYTMFVWDSEYPEPFSGLKCLIFVCVLYFTVVPDILFAFCVQLQNVC